MLISISLFFVIFLTLLHDGLLPTVFADEWLYSDFSRLQPLSKSVVPSYLFLMLYKITYFFGDHFLGAARFLNVCFFSLSLPLIYVVARQVTSPIISLYIAILSLLDPINSYTAYFMPESLYFFSFWIFIVFVLHHLRRSAFMLGGGAGLILSLMALIKMHAIFLLASFIIYLLLMGCYRINGMHIKKMIWTIGYVLLAFFIVRLTIGYGLGGMKGLSLFGEKYHQHVESFFVVHRLITVFHSFIIPFVGHILGLTVLFAMPFLLLTEKIPHHESYQFLKMITLIFFIILLCITIFTTAEIVGWDSYEIINRIHMRYYNFIFPLFFIITGAHLNVSDKNYSVKSLVLASLLMIVCFCSLFYLRKYILSFIDCPELFGIAYHYSILPFFCWIEVICLLLWIIRKKWGVIIYFFIFLPSMVVLSTYFVHAELRQERFYNMDAYDHAGQFARQYLKTEASKLLVIGSERAGLYKALFYIDNPDTTINELEEHVPLQFAKIPIDKTWILAIGDYPSLTKVAFRIKKADFTLIKLKVARG